MITRKTWVPKEEQLFAIKTMLSQAAVALFADPGVGKTSICLTAFKLLKDAGLAKKMLVVAPIFPMYNSWPGELAKWEHLKDLTYTIIHDKPNETREQALEKDVDIYLVNYEGLLWLFPDNSVKALRKERHTRNLRWRWDVFCADESTSLKDPGTKRFSRLRPHCGDFNRRWILTGTPIPNGYQDLFGQIFILDSGGALGSYITHFRNKYMMAKFSGHGYEMRPGATEAIEAKIAPYVVRLEGKYDHQIVPLFTDVYLPDDLMETYKDLEDQFFITINSVEISAANAGVVGNKLRQFANGAIYSTDEEDERFTTDVHDYKLQALDSMLAELNGNPVIVFYEFLSDKERILKRHPKTPYLGGGQSGTDSKKIIKDFNAGKIPVLLTHPKSAAHGLNLQESAYHVIWFSMTWNLEWYIQGNARLARQGQKNPYVYVHHIRCVGTRDERVSEVISQKDVTQTRLLQALVSE